MTMRLRNAPVANTISLEAGGWSTQLQLAAGEEREIELPFTASDAVLLRLEASAGFVPAQVDPSSRDTRFLGVAVSIANR